MQSSLFPAFLKLTGRPVLLVGGGAVAAGKLNGLLAAGAAVTVVAPDVQPEIARASAAVHRRPFAPADLDGIWFVVAAAPPEVNRQVAAAAEPRGIFVNAVDDLASASAYAPAVLRRGDVTVAVGTEGHAPALAGLLREGLGALLPDETEDWLSCARELRRQWIADGVPMERRRPLLLDALVRLYREPAAGAAS